MEGTLTINTGGPRYSRGRLRCGRRRAPALLASAAVIALASTLGACGSSSATPSSSGASGTTTGSAPSGFYGPPTKVTGDTATVDVIDNDFTPKNLVIDAGTKVTFDATGHNQHDIAPDDPEAFDFTVPAAKLPPGGKATFTFSKPGRYYYYCTIHATPTAGSMRAVITVLP